MSTPPAPPLPKSAETKTESVRARRLRVNDILVRKSAEQWIQSIRWNGSKGYIKLTGEINPLEVNDMEYYSRAVVWWRKMHGVALERVERDGRVLWVVKQ